jgi:hypothetical protein
MCLTCLVPMFTAFPSVIASVLCCLMCLKQDSEDGLARFTRQ